MCFLSVSHRNIPTQYIAQLVERSPRLQNVVGSRAVNIFLWKKSCPGRVVEYVTPMHALHDI